MRIIPVGLAVANTMALNLAIQWKLVVIQPFKADASTSPFHLLVPGNFPIRHAGIKRRLVASACSGEVSKSLLK